MKILGFTGTRDVTHERAERILFNHHALLSNCDGFVTGACQGWDAFAGPWLLRMYPHLAHTVVVPANRSLVEFWWESPEADPLFARLYVQGGTFVIVEMPPDSTYRDRNSEIVDLSDMLFYCAAYPENSGHSHRSGTWQTVRLGRRSSRPVVGVVLNR